MHQSATVSGALPDFQESLVPSKLFRNNELVISLLRVNYLIKTSYFSRYYELVFSLLRDNYLVITT